ncbi:metal ABC transporter ATP-binding protein [Roseomonas sp. SSH11]|uniref:Metal ABC transporter ATP-binding protein n=1 Tax=Pararoseomonas baculiformis TaxID=2820812 RepID=A0ABS4A9K4_9PROT|nr:metal ABC transporter ATP-binding protein [Pararoseomonas baculiformis]MBP0443667.1 metal ABC transporter ATP-binding protein [Pararoseomonas baculiformis]
MLKPLAPDLSVESVSVVYPNGHTALRGAGFRLESGTICGLVGVNGAGKSTLFKAIMGLVRPTAGRVLIGGEPVEAALRRNRVAYVPQGEEVDWNFPVSVRDVVMMGRYGHMGILRIPRAADRAAVADALGRVGLSDLAERQIGELSGGQRKRVFLARAMAQGAGILLLDEPFTGVDATTEQAIIALLRGFREEGRIVLVSTHDLASIPSFCDQVVLVNRTVLAAGPTGTAFTEENLRLAFGNALRRGAAGRLPEERAEGRAA